MGSETACRRKDHDPETYGIIGAALEVHKELGPGFLEPVYQDCLAMELAGRGVPFEREVPLQIHYKGQLLHRRYRADFVCHGAVLVELKAQSHLGSAEAGQMVHYLRCLGFRRGLLLNFGNASLDAKRFVNSVGAIGEIGVAGQAATKP